MTSERAFRTASARSNGRDEPRQGGRIVPAPDVRPFELGEHNCFACGSLNEHGLRLVIHVARGRAWTELELDASFEGWSGMAHGGIIATILDEVMAWSLVGEENWGMTARMAIDFRRPVPIAAPLRADGRIERARRRLVDTTAELVDATSGEVLATATATYLAASGERRRELQARYGFRYLDGGRSSQGIGAR